MKFFSDLGSCYRPALPPPEEPAVDGGGVHVRPMPCSSTKPKKQSRNWRPALLAISEDGAVVSVNESVKRVESIKKSPPSKSTGGSSAAAAAKDRRRGSRYNNHADVYDQYYSRKKSMPMFIPAFSPTPYMF
ncbi:hypothetical protein LWI28_019942 [Acer negundo]|uniref:Uncharacterized protein n=1 Tax=Acer negundo TaxID=4023 RepID=A0AAD5IWN1_ACENE|nr:hypothetical protein LWI28_013290 [Acer negundo]KAI9177856.1 hypothetical protein LWI28_019942 [Acer negundo]KAK4847098.1 hypothetical protein QYF36_025511 [Acer negundo]